MDKLEIILKDFETNLLENFLINEVKIVTENIISSNFYSNTEGKNLEFFEIKNLLDIYNSPNTGYVYLKEINLGLPINLAIIILSFNATQGDVIINFPENEVISSDKNETTKKFYKIVEYLLQLKKKFSIKQIRLGYESAYDDDMCIANLDDNESVEKIMTSLVLNL